MSAELTMTLEVFRYHPRDRRRAALPVVRGPLRRGTGVVLDALNWIKDHVDGSLTHRWSCRMGVCGSCGMMVNGDPKLTCAAFLKDYFPRPIKVEPLVNFPVERDLAVSLDGFMDKLQAVKPYIIRDDVNDTSGGEYRQSPAELARYKQYSMCINCMLCYSACPVAGHEDEFLGPAALALGHRYNKDSRDRGPVRTPRRDAGGRGDLGLHVRGRVHGGVSQARGPGGRDPAGEGDGRAGVLQTVRDAERGGGCERQVSPAPRLGMGSWNARATSASWRASSPASSWRATWSCC